MLVSNGKITWWVQYYTGLASSNSERLYLALQESWLLICLWHCKMPWMKIQEMPVHVCLLRHQTVLFLYWINTNIHHAFIFLIFSKKDKVFIFPASFCRCWHENACIGCIHTPLPHYTPKKEKHILTYILSDIQIVDVGFLCFDKLFNAFQSLTFHCCKFKGLYVLVFLKYLMIHSNQYTCVSFSSLWTG